MLSLSTKAGDQSYSSEQPIVVNGQDIGQKVVATYNSGYGKQEIFKKEGQAQWCDFFRPQRGYAEIKTPVAPSK